MQSRTKYGGIGNGKLKANEVPPVMFHTPDFRVRERRKKEEKEDICVAMLRKCALLYRQSICHNKVDAFSQTWEFALLLYRIDP